MTPILDQISSPVDLKELSADQLKELAAELRAELIQVVSAKGGHIGPNLGIIELTIALLKTFSPPEDKIIWDVGHQGYVYKMLTGRRKFLRDTLREDDGCCGFMNRDESEYDPFGAGHAGTALSAALGMAKARDLNGSSEKVIAIVGDGSIGCGISFEALNQVSETTRDLIVILNDNEMSIAGNVGALANYLNQQADRISRGPRPDDKSRIVNRSAHRPGDLFRDLGFTYLGPVDGHNIPMLVDILTLASENHGPVIIHAITEKGRGYKPAKCNPELFHGLGNFDPVTGKAIKSKSKKISFSKSFGNALVNLAESDPKITAITAGMCLGTGLEQFREKFPERYSDVGIAEEHAVIYAAGLATGGIKPVVAIYGTFMQRAMDCVYHDVCLQDLPVVFCLDRAGAVADGPTHHGIYDLSFWLSLPNLAVIQPSSDYEMHAMLKMAVDSSKPVVIRYPKSNCPDIPVDEQVPVEWGKAVVANAEGEDAFMWAVGAEVATALKVQRLLKEQGVNITVVNPRFLDPFDKVLFAEHYAKAPVITLEDHVMDGGFAALTDRVANELGGGQKIDHFGWPRDIIPWGTSKGIREKYGLLPEQITEEVVKGLRP